MPEGVKIQDIEHPEYTAKISQWDKYRLVYKADDDFIDEYLQKFSTRENAADFTARKSITPISAHSKAALIDIQNAIHQRLTDIIRKGGPQSYRRAIAGEEGGVDFRGKSMNTFIGRNILIELLVQGKVGVYVDKSPIPLEASILDSQNSRPYLYTYVAEDIKSWNYDLQNNLISVLLRDRTVSLCPETGLPCELVESYRLMRLVEDGVEVLIYDLESMHIGTTFLNLSKIPIVIFELTQSLLNDIANHQIALLNLASSDMNYATKSNYPFYVEQFNPAAQMMNMRPPSIDSDTGEPEATSDNAKKAGEQSIETGVSQGRGYPKGLERPGFIHPSSEPIRASMDKQDQLKAEIRQLLNLALTAIEPRRASAESRNLDQQNKQEGINSIGLELAAGERQIAQLWSIYEDADDDVIIQYPANYSMKTDLERREEAEQFTELGPKIASETYRRLLAKRAANSILGPQASMKDIEAINAEIDAAEIPFTDPQIIREDHEAGFVSDATASRLRGYSDNEVIQAQKDHAERLRRISESQSSPNEQLTAPAARGIGDMDVTPLASAKEEKTISSENNS